MLREVLWKHRTIFKGIGRVKAIKHRIKLMLDVEPAVTKIRRRSLEEKRVEEETISRLLKHGIMEESDSHWAANNVFVPKKD